MAYPTSRALRGIPGQPRHLAVGGHTSGGDPPDHVIECAEDCAAHFSRTSYRSVLRRRGWQLGPYRLQPFHVQVRVQVVSSAPGPAEHGAPGIHGDGVAVGHVGALFVPGGGDPHGEALVVHCPLAEEKFPVGGGR